MRICAFDFYYLPHKGLDMSNLAKVMQGQSQKGLKLYKKGGSVHSDEAQDKVLIKKMIKQAEKKEEVKESKMKCGGKVKKK